MLAGSGDLRRSGRLGLTSLLNRGPSPLIGRALFFSVECLLGKASVTVPGSLLDC